MPERIPDSDHINQVHQVPRNPASLGYKDGKQVPDPQVISRSRFLDNSDYNRPAYWSMFMPGQNGRGAPPGAPGSLPTDWPAAGSPLRVPKCVYLTSCPPAHLWGQTFVLMTVWNSSMNGYFGHYNDSKARDTRTWSPNYEPPQQVPSGSLLFDGFSGGYEYIGWTIDPQYDKREEHRRGWRQYAVVHNAIVDEHLRLIGEFKIAKAYLERTYPNELYVVITGFFPEEPQSAIAPRDDRLPKVLDVYTAEGIAQNTPTMLTEGPLWMLGPDTVQYDLAAREWITPFFGTNFLHIYCGYQAVQGRLFLGESFDTSNNERVPDISDLTDNRVNFADSKQGYALNTRLDFRFGETLWYSQTYDGYELGAPDGAGRSIDAYQEMLEINEKFMSQSTTYNQGTANERTQPQGKLDLLRIGWRNFAGYRVSLHEYDLAWDFGQAVTKMKNGDGVRTAYPCYSVNYEDQDWVEQYRFNYDTVVSQYGSGAPYHDECYPGANGPGYPGRAGTATGVDGTGNQATDNGRDGGGGTFNAGGDYNSSSRFPGTDMYEAPGGYNDQLKAQYDNLKKAMLGAGPKCAAMWQELIDTYDLGSLGFRYDGGSSALDSDAIIRYVEDYYGLKKPVPADDAAGSADTEPGSGGAGGSGGGVGGF